MKGPAKKLTLSAAVLACLATVTACGAPQTTAAHHAVRHVPRPVTQSGMTLDWGKDVKQQALAMINGSKHSAYLDIYELSDPDILQALIAAKKRGVDVRVIVDATETHSQTTAVPALSTAGVPVESLRIHRGISHIKMLITDGTHSGVLIGGMNFGAHSWNNNDASVYLSHPNPSFLAVFHWDWQRADLHPAEAPATQMPLLIDGAIGREVVEAIEHAQKTVSLEGFDVSDYAVIDALAADVKRGVTVEVLLDPQQKYNRKTASTLRDEGITVRFYRPYDDEWMHAKIVDVDQGTCFIIGSANFSHQAYTYNHEGDVELHNVPAFDKSFQEDLSIQIARGTDYPAVKKKKY